LLSRLRHPDGGPVPATYATVIGIVFGAMYGPAQWPALAVTLQAFFDQTGPATAARQAPAVARAFDTNYHNALDASWGIACTDTDNPREPATWARAAAEAAEAAPHFGAIATWFSLPCATWLARDEDRLTGPFTARTSSPVLVVGNLYDPATPYQAAQTVARQLPNARLLTFTGWGHATLRGKNACIDDYLARSARAAGTSGRRDLHAGPPALRITDAGRLGDVVLDSNPVRTRSEALAR
jgi:pimeloyl-ACP methyl ester carboxylesterase